MYNWLLHLINGLPSKNCSKDMASKVLWKRKISRSIIPNSNRRPIGSGLIDVNSFSIHSLIDSEQPKLRSEHFDWKGYYPLETIYRWLDEQINRYPELLTGLKVGTSYEKRTIRAVKYSQKAVSGGLDFVIAHWLKRRIDFDSREIQRFSSNRPFMPANGSPLQRPPTFWMNY